MIITPDTLYVYLDEDDNAVGITDKPDFRRAFHNVPYTATGETWSMGIQRIWVAYEGKTICRAFGTKADMLAYVAETGNDDTGRMMLNWEYPR
ncbi:MAG: hypothetical protein RIT25_1455 [Planctomycetota bacterium]